MVSTWRQGAGGWGWWAPRAAARARAADDARLGDARIEFLAMLADLRGGATLQLRERIRNARDLADLWHLRTDVFSQVAVQRNQAEAQDRLGWLNQWFPTRAPRSGFGALGHAEAA